MKYLIFFAAIVTVTIAIPLGVAEDEEGQQYYLVPVSREKRETTWGVSDSGVNVGHKGTILNNDRNILDGSVYAGKTFGTPGLRPDQVGGLLDYTHKPSGSGAFIGADNVRHFGTDVSAGVKYNLYKNKDFGVDAVGQYSRHFGGPSGTGRPDGYIGIQAEGKF